MSQERDWSVAVPVAARVAGHKERQVARGLRRVAAWVPKDQVGTVKAVAAYLRADAGCPLPMDGQLAKSAQAELLALSRAEFGSAADLLTELSELREEVARRGPGPQSPGDAVRPPAERLELQRQLQVERARADQLELELRKTSQASIAPHQKIGRNQPCPCGSGKKHKRCCGR